jgi:hypothetical protein
MNKETDSQDLEKNKPSKLISTITFSIFLLCWLLALLILIQPLLRTLALNEPTFKNGVNNAVPIIDALEKYKAEYKSYPTTRYGLLVYDDTLEQRILYDYKYETYPFTDSPTEYMISFRKRWSLDEWYCYYSEDQKWLEATSTCWSKPRPSR